MNKKLTKKEALNELNNLIKKNINNDNLSYSTTFDKGKNHGLELAKIIIEAMK